MRRKISLGILFLVFIVLYISIECGGRVLPLRLYVRDGKVTSVTVNMGAASLKACDLPAKTETETMLSYPLLVGNKTYRVTGVSVGNPHAVVFCDSIDSLNVSEIGPGFEYAEIFPERVNTEFVRVVNKTTLRMRVWERGNGETFACGSGACAAVVAAVLNGFCEKNTDITVKLRGGDLVVNYSDKGVLLTGSVALVFEGEFEY